MASIPNSDLRAFNAFRSRHEDLVHLTIDKSYPKQLRDLFPFQTLTFTYIPEEFSLSGADPNWNEVEVFGRFEPYQIWSSTSAETIAFTLQFFAENDCITDVKQKVDWLRAMKYPVHYKNISYRPPTLLFVWGKFLRRRVILKEATPSFRSPWYVEDDGNIDRIASQTLAGNRENAVDAYPLYPMQAQVSVSLATVSTEPISGHQVMQGIF